MFSVVLLLLLSPGEPQQAPSPTVARAVTCAFSNPGYSGWCRVTDAVPAGSTPRTICRGILGCLNNVQCVKTYCNATTIHGRWRLESVRTGAPKKPPA